MKSSRKQIICISYTTTLLLLLGQGTLIKAQTWALQTSGTTQKLNSIYAISSASVFVAGNGGMARKTSNGGALWQFHNLGTPENQNSIRFINQNTGYTAGRFQDIMLTTNGGSSWTNIGGGITELYDGYFISSSSGWVVGDIEAGFGFLYNPFTFNFVTNSINANKALYGIYFANATTGWAVGDAGLIMKTTNFGSSWAQLNSTVNTRLNKVMFIDPNNGIVVGNNGLILKTANGGSSWTAQTTTTANLNAVYYADPSNIWVCGDNGTILHSSNAGAAWSQETSNTTENLNAIHGSGITNLWACGNNGVILSRTQCTVVPAAPSSIVGPGIICVGSTRVYSVSPIAGASSYNWTLPVGWSGTSATNTISVTATANSGTLSVSAQNNCGSSADVSLIIATSPSPTVTVQSSGQVLCEGSTATLSAGGADIYSWLPAHQNGSTLSITPTITTSYTVEGSYTNQLGCSSQAIYTQTVVNCNGLVNDPHPINLFRIYPNPNKGDLNIESSSGMILWILDPLGQVINMLEVQAGTNALHLDQLDKGIYFISPQGQSSRAIKFVKE